MTEGQWLRCFGKNLLSMLREYNMTQQEFADRCGISKSMVSRYVNGRRIPDLKTLINMGYALRCSLDDLTDFGEPIR